MSSYYAPPTPPTFAVTLYAHFRNLIRISTLTKVSKSFFIVTHQTRAMHKNWYSTSWQIMWNTSQDDDYKKGCKLFEEKSAPQRKSWPRLCLLVSAGSNFGYGSGTVLVVHVFDIALLQSPGALWRVYEALSFRLQSEMCRTDPYARVWSFYFRLLYNDYIRSLIRGVFTRLGYSFFAADQYGLITRYMVLCYMRAGTVSDNTRIFYFAQSEVLLK